MYAHFFKRLLDILMSLAGIIILSPVLIYIALQVRKRLGAPVIFKQPRPGKNEKIFYMYKFRTMTDEKDANGRLMSDSERLTDYGRFLRNTSLDELPELFNILKGDMSVVGPRPQLVRDMVFMTTEQRQRHTVRQGLTGLAQINGRNNITWEEKLDYDLQYIKNITLLEDIRIIFRTFAKVKHSEGVSAEGMDTAEDFGEYLLRHHKITNEQYSTRHIEAKKLLTVGAKV